ncbi:MAG: hypothetical protein ACK4QW_10020 [Alphaproteobacteria bacterium]
MPREIGHVDRDGAQPGQHVARRPPGRAERAPRPAHEDADGDRRWRREDEHHAPEQAAVAGARRRTLADPPGRQDRRPAAQRQFQPDERDIVVHALEDVVDAAVIVRDDELRPHQPVGLVADLSAA